MSFLQCLFLIYFNKCGLYYFLDKTSVCVSRVAGGDGCLSLCFQSKLSTRASAEAMEWGPIPNGNRNSSPSESFKTATIPQTSRMMEQAKPSNRLTSLQTRPSSSAAQALPVLCVTSAPTWLMKRLRKICCFSTKS